MSDEPDDAWGGDRPSEQEVQEFLDGIDGKDAASAPTDRTETATGVGDVIYAWQMRVRDGWNIIGATLPNGITLPLVTTSLGVAWEAFEVAQAHANRGQCQVRLATFVFETLAAIVEPNE